MKIVVVSDTHGNNAAILDIMSREPDAKMLLHCGDICADDREISSKISCPSMVTSPAVAARLPVIMFIVVDLPAPFGPRNP